MRGAVAAALLLAAVSVASPALAEDEARTAARDIARKGDAEFASGRCSRAIALWKKAEATFHAPTILLRIARCEALTGKVVEASATLQKVADEKLAADAPTAFVDAQQSAREEIAYVRSRIATLSVAVWAKGTTVQPTIEIDDLAMPAGRRSFAVNPGTHRVRVRAAGSSWDGSLTLDEGEARALRVTLRPEEAVDPPRTWRNIGLVLGGLGVASLAVGTGFAVSASETSSDLASVCGKHRTQCPPGHQGDIDRLRAHALVADLTIGAGGAFLLGGAVVVLTEPKPQEEAPRVRLAPAAMGAAVSGDF